MQDIDAVEDWLIEQALGSALVPDMFAEMCRRLRDCQVPIDRAMLAWATLHPLIRAEMAFWQAGEAVRHERIEHRETVNEAWLASPMRALLNSGEPMLRRRLDQANADYDFPVCRRVVALIRFRIYLIGVV